MDSGVVIGIGGIGLGCNKSTLNSRASTSLNNDDFEGMDKELYQEALGAVSERKKVFNPMDVKV